MRAPSPSNSFRKQTSSCCSSVISHIDSQESISFFFLSPLRSFVLFRFSFFAVGFVESTRRGRERERELKLKEELQHVCH